MRCPFLALSVVQPDEMENRVAHRRSQWYREVSGLVRRYCQSFGPQCTSGFHWSTEVLPSQDERSIGRGWGSCDPASMTRHEHPPRKGLSESAAAVSRRPGVGLALGGGFARGFAHLGVLQVFEQSHIPISHIAGTSVGSILGAAYASGAPLARIMETCRTLRFRDIARWRVSRLGLASNHRLEN